MDDRKLVLIAYSKESCEPKQDAAFSTILSSLENSLSRSGCCVELLGCEDHVRAARMFEEIHLKPEYVGTCLVGKVKWFFPPQRNGPIIQLGCKPPELCSGWCGVDYYAAGSACAAYLLANNHRDIALVTNHRFYIENFGFFIRGFEAAFEQTSAPFRRDLVFQSLAHENPADIFEVVLNTSRKPTASVLVGSEVCREVLRRMEERHIKCPEQISLIGYGLNIKDIPMATLMATYMPNYELMAQEAAGLMLSFHQKRSTEFASVVVEGTLNEGQSVRKITDQEQTL